MIHIHTEGVHTDGTYIQNGGTSWSDIHMRVHAHKGHMHTERIYTRRVDIHMEDIHMRICPNRSFFSLKHNFPVMTLAPFGGLLVPKYRFLLASCILSPWPSSIQANHDVP